MMGVPDFHNWILLSVLTVLFLLLTSLDCVPMNSKAAGWMNTSEDNNRSYSHIGGSNKFSKPFVSQPSRSSHFKAVGNTSNKTLAAILFLTVFGIAATALLVVLCSKMTKKEQYDAVKGTIY